MLGKILNSTLQSVLTSEKAPSYMFHRPFADVFKIGVPKNFAILTITGKHPCSSLFLIKLQTFKPTTFLKRDSRAGVLMWILRNFYEEFFLLNICGGNLYFNYLLNFNIFHCIHGQTRMTLCSAYLLNNKDFKTCFLTICFCRLCY